MTKLAQPPEGLPNPLLARCVNRFAGRHQPRHRHPVLGQDERLAGAHALDKLGEVSLGFEDAHVVLGVLAHSG